MKCPDCRTQMQIDEKLSRGMGNQSIQRCPNCGLMVLVSGEVVTQTWKPEKVPA